MTDSDTPEVVVVEDDLYTATELADELRSRLPEARITTVDSEAAFLEHLEVWEEDPPEAFVIDIMLRWSHPGSGAPSPGADLGDFHKAGLRCVERIKAQQWSPDPLLVLLTALPASDLVNLDLMGAHLYHKGDAWRRLLDMLVRHVKGDAGS